MSRNRCEADRLSQEIIDIDSAALFNILGPENNVLLADEIMLCDADGTVLRISQTYEKNFGFPPGSVLGRSVYDLEREGIFSPSVTAEVIRTRKKVTTTQSIRGYSSVMTTGVPLFGRDGGLKYVICFNTLTLEQINSIQKKYDQLLYSVRQYTEEIQELRLKNTASQEIVFRSKAMTDLWDMLLHCAGTKANVLITGETGVGKSLVAKAIHNMSDRSSGPFIEINCGVIHENLMESELFGYEKGAFTGASALGKIGKIELAHNGTLFLDEIGELPMAVQTKLLDVIQSKTFERVSGTKKMKVDFRLITATNREPEREMERGLFRKDLYYRLNVLRIHIPPLRDRRDDIFPLVLKFLNVYNKEYNKNVSISPRLLDFLERYSWPGNIRQLQNLMERLVIICRTPVVDVGDLPYDLTHNLRDAQGSATDRERRNAQGSANGRDRRDAEGSATDPDRRDAQGSATDRERRDAQESATDRERRDAEGLPKARPSPRGKSLPLLMEAYEEQLVLSSYNQWKTSTAVAKDLGVSQATAARKLLKYVKNKG